MYLPSRSSYTFNVIEKFIFRLSFLSARRLEVHIHLMSLESLSLDYLFYLPVSSKLQSKKLNFLKNTCTIIIHKKSIKHYIYIHFSIISYPLVCSEFLARCHFLRCTDYARRDEASLWSSESSRPQRSRSTSRTVSPKHSYT